ncbi:uncharacterized protein C12orf50 homolog [Eudromia elegans]
MAEIGNDRYFYSTCTKQKYNISCFWETQPLGCVRISCVFHHSKPRNINGLFLPPSSNTILQQDVQEGPLHPTCVQESLKNQEDILRPVHPPLIININHQEDEEEEEEEENYISYFLAKTAVDIEEERAIKEMCYKSGEYYGIQSLQEHQSTKTVSSALEDELLPLGAVRRDLQKATNFTELVKKHQFKGVKKKKWISEDTRNSINTVTGKAMHTSTPQIKVNYQRNDQIKADESTSYIPSVRAAGRRTYLNSSEPGSSAYVFYRNVTVFQEPKLNGCMDKNTSGSCNTPTWRKRNPRAKTFSKLKTTVQSQEEMETNKKGEKFAESRKK